MCHCWCLCPCPSGGKRDCTSSLGPNCGIQWQVCVFGGGKKEITVGSSAGGRGSMPPGLNHTMWGWCQALGPNPDVQGRKGTVPAPEPDPGARGLVQTMDQPSTTHMACRAKSLSISVL